MYHINSTNLAAIDIGSNAARILIKSVKKTNNGLRSKKLQFLRIPLRLGMDVFGTGEIGKEREKMLLRTMKVFRQLLILYDVKDYRICATSAFREAKNGDKVLKHAPYATITLAMATYCIWMWAEALQNCHSYAMAS